MALSQLDTAACQIAAVVGAEHPIMEPVSRGVISEVTTHTFAELSHQVQPLTSQIARLPGNGGNQVQAQVQKRGHGRGHNTDPSPQGRNRNPRAKG